MLALAESDAHARERVLSCGDGRRDRSFSRRNATLPGHATQPREVLEIDWVHVGATSMTSNEYFLLAVDKASKLPFAFPLPLKQAEGVARGYFTCFRLRIP